MHQLTIDQLYRFTKIDPQAFATEPSDIFNFMQRFHPRAYQSLNFGLHLKRNHNHIFIMGEAGVGRIGMTKAMLQEAAKQKPMPDDVVLVADFKDHTKTRYLYFKAGLGYQFKQAIESLTKQLKTQLPVVFDGHAYQLRSQAIERELNENQEQALQPAFDLAQELGISIEQTENSFVLTALIDGEKIRLSELKAIEHERQEYFADALNQVETKLNEGLSRFPTIQHEFIDKGKQLNTQVAIEHIEPLIKKLKQEFNGENTAVSQYLDDLQQALVAKLHLFWDAGGEQVTTSAGSQTNDPKDEADLSAFNVNLLVDHRNLQHAPVIYEQNASLAKLFGYTINSATANAADNLTLAMNHQAGLLQKANGGYLILNIQSILREPDLWSVLKAALMSRQITFEIPSSSSIVPYHLPDFPLNLTLVLVGDAEHFYVLQELDPEFSRLFKVQVEFEHNLERSKDHELALAQQLAEEIKDWDDLPIELCALERLVEHAARLAEDSQRLYANKAVLRDVIAEANAFARANKQDKLTREIIEKTLAQHEFHTGLMEDHFHRSIVEKQVFLSTSGSQVGQINGLTVLTLGRQSFGQPVRITAQVSAGDDGVIDIEREIEMAGPMHSKGVMILTGFLRGRYMRMKSLGFTGSLVIEQNYSGIEGDSASSAELLALLSAIANIPLRQDLAITGSVNQFGQIQPIGGVNEKIEGFFKICKQLGLTGKQGAVIPKANIRHLMLADEVCAAVAKGEFTIYAIDHIDQALEIFTGETSESFDRQALQQLEKMNEKPADE